MSREDTIYIWVLSHSGSPVSNQSIVSLEDVRQDRDVFCFTNYDTELSRVGSWYFPDGSEVSGSGSGIIHNRGRSFVSLSYSGSGSSPSGLYHCVIPDSDGQDVTLLVGIYEIGQGRNRTFPPLN